ncbi:hypothetical protein RND81_04G016900 [Saponaria officinalis]|uniref:rRNA N-glycosylase n=1 Tax=Saponaria officinalis TaxID=3572 RepID=A0AAW1LID4_SAPOF
MKSWLLVVIAWVILQSASLRAVTLTLDLTSSDVEQYSTFLDSIRTNVKDPNLKYGGTTIPVVAKPSNTFLRIDLKVSDGTVSLGLLRNDLYVVAHLTMNEKGKFVAYSFKNLIKPAQLDTLFPEAKGAANQKTLEYDESYKSLENKAEVKSRKKVGLGIKNLADYIDGVNGKVRKVKDEAKFIIATIQMVAEASRFKYIENLVRNNFPNGFTPDDKVIIFERNWKRTTEAIKASKNGVFGKSIEFTSEEAPKSKITAKNADELEMGLLKYLGYLNQFTTSYCY